MLNSFYTTKVHVHLFNWLMHTSIYQSIYLASSVNKESACNAGDLGSFPGLGRSPGDGKGYPLQYSGLKNGLYSPWGRQESDTNEELSVNLSSTQWRKIFVQPKKKKKSCFNKAYFNPLLFTHSSQYPLLKYEICT